MLHSCLPFIAKTYLFLFQVFCTGVLGISYVLSKSKKKVRHAFLSHSNYVFINGILYLV